MNNWKEILESTEPINSAEKDFVDQMDHMAEALAAYVKWYCQTRIGHLPAPAQVYFLKRFSDILGNPLRDKDELTLKMLDAIRVLIKGFQEKGP